jgi:HlyD family secretion protein
VQQELPVKINNPMLPDQEIEDHKGEHFESSSPAASQARDIVPAVPAKLPVPLPVRKSPIRLWAIALLAVAAIAGAGLSSYWWSNQHPPLPLGIVYGNGRLEADEIDIDTKYAGRIAELSADEGDFVKAGQVLARMDTRDLEASLKKSQAQVQQAQKAVDEANANVTQQNAQVVLAKQEYDRAEYLVKKGFQTKEVLDQRKQQLDSTDAALTASKLRVIILEHALQAATHDVELYSVQIADNTLLAPREGRIQYRVANIGEVLPAGGKVFVILDTSYVYMDIYLPTKEAGKIRYGDDARIVLDAYPNLTIPAQVSFIASLAQFTPKAVETQSERDKLMFRIRVRIDPERLRQRSNIVRSGLPGVTYVKADRTARWPDWLQGAIG